MLVVGVPLTDRQVGDRIVVVDDSTDHQSIEDSFQQVVQVRFLHSMDNAFGVADRLSDIEPQVDQVTTVLHRQSEVPVTVDLYGPELHEGMLPDVLFPCPRLGWRIELWERFLAVALDYACLGSLFSENIKGFPVAVLEQQRGDEEGEQKGSASYDSACMPLEVMWRVRCRPLCHSISSSSARS